MRYTDNQCPVAAARAWLGTPYVHQASSIHKGADCLGLIRGVWRELIGSEPAEVPEYSPDWSEPSGQERLWDAAAKHLTPVEIDLARIGDVALFRVRQGVVAKHLGILAVHPSGVPSLIHAYSGRGVVETPLNRGWQRRLVAQFRFPNTV